MISRRLTKARMLSAGPDRRLVTGIRVTVISSELSMPGLGERALIISSSTRDLACSNFKSTAGAPSAADDPERHPGGSSRSAAFQVVIWFG